MAFLNFLKTGTSTKIKQSYHGEDDGNINLTMQVLESKDSSTEVIPKFSVDISRDVSIEEYKKIEISKLYHPGNTKPDEMEQTEYDELIDNYTTATQKIYDDSLTMCGFSQHFTKDALYNSSNFTKLAYEWCKNLPMFEGVASDE